MKRASCNCVSYWRTLGLALLAGMPLVAGGAYTNWVAYNDHAAGAGTAPNVTTYTSSTADPNTVGGALTDFATGSPLGAQVFITAKGQTLNGATGSSTPPNPGTPADAIFGGKVDFNNSAYYFCASPWTASHTITFTNLDPNKKYVFKGTAVRGNNYATRWASVMIIGAANAVPAHEQGPGSVGIVTNGWSPYGDLCAPNIQVAYNCGENRWGDVLGWEEIEPINGGFSIVSSNWLAATPGGAANSTYCYAINAFMIAEVESTLTPIEIVQQPVGTNVTAFRPFSLTVRTTGSRPQYQWYKDNVEIPGATNATYAVALAQVDQSGSYYVKITGALNTVDSETVQVNVAPDDVAPVVLSTVGSASYQEITLAFSENMNTNVGFELFDFTLDPDPIATGFSGYSWVGQRVLILTNYTPTAPGTVHTVTLPATLTDLAGNPVPEPRTVQFKSWVANPMGGIVFQVYPGLSTSDNNITNVLTNANFPDLAAETYILPGMNTRAAYPDDSHEGYGGRLYGLFIPPYTGQWRFFVYSDDSSQVYLNPAGPDPAGKVLIALETGCCNPFTEPPSPRTSEPISLVGGQAYYIETVYKEGTGGDYCYVAARGEGDPTPAGSLVVITNSAAGAAAAPEGVVGTMSIAEQPANAQAAVNDPAVFRVRGATTLGSPFVYQWQRSDDGGATFVDIAGAMGPVYRIGAAAPGDNGAKFRALVRCPAGEMVSEVATLTVGADTTPPVALTAVAGRATNTTIVVTFSENLEQGSAEDTLNYELLGPGGITVLGASLAGNVVTLTLSGPRQPGQAYQLVVKDVKDASPSQNPVSPNPTTLALRVVEEVIGINTHEWKRLSQAGDGLPAPCLDGTLWTTAGYDDSGWIPGMGVFYGDRDPADLPTDLDGTPVMTYITVYTNASNVRQSTVDYFRTTFTLPFASTNGVRLLYHGMIDDGCVFYLNGNRVGNVGFTTDPAYCTNLSTAGGGQTWVPALSAPGTELGITGLVPGVNTLAVQVSQNSQTSSDVTFGLWLEAEGTGLAPAAPTLQYTYNEGTKTLTLSWSGTGYHLQEADSLSGPWNNIGNTSPQSVSTATGTKFYRLHQM